MIKRYTVINLFVFRVLSLMFTKRQQLSSQSLPSGLSISRKLLMPDGYPSCVRSCHPHHNYITWHKPKALENKLKKQTEWLWLWLYHYNLALTSMAWTNWQKMRHHTHADTYHRHINFPLAGKSRKHNTERRLSCWPLFFSPVLFHSVTALKISVLLLITWEATVN